jgi:outer membrane protein assembly factor BamB
MTVQSIHQRGSVMRILFALSLLAGFGCTGEEEPRKPPHDGSDWPTLAGPNGNFTSPEIGILTKWPENGLPKRWEAALGFGYAPPVVAAGRVFHFDRIENSATLTCRNAVNGKAIWKYSYPTSYVDSYGYEPGPRACPVVDGERVYLHGVEGMVCCVSTADGKEIWKADTKRDHRFHQNFFGVGSVPLVVDDLLLVPVGGSTDGPRPIDLRDVKSNGSAFVAFDKKTGAEKYKCGDDLASYSSPLLATFHGKQTVLYFARSGLLGFDPATGKERFRFAWRAKSQESVNAANPVVIDDTILLTECYEKGSILLRVSKEFQLETVWSDEANDRREKSLLGHWCTPVVEGKYAYGCSGRHESEGDLRCIELATGKVLWVVPRTRRCTLTKIDGQILCMGEEGTLQLFKPNPEKFESVAVWNEKNNKDLQPPCWAPPVVSRGLLYLRGKGKLVCYELNGGK